MRLTTLTVSLLLSSMKHLPNAFMAGILALMLMTPECGTAKYDDDPIEADGIGTSPSDPEPNQGTCVADSTLADSPQ